MTEGSCHRKQPILSTASMAKKLITHKLRVKQNINSIFFKAAVNWRLITCCYTHRSMPFWPSSEKLCPTVARDKVETHSQICRLERMTLKHSTLPKSLLWAQGTLQKVEVKVERVSSEHILWLSFCFNGSFAYQYVSWDFSFALFICLVCFLLFNCITFVLSYLCYFTIIPEILAYFLMRDRTGFI